MPIRHFYIIFLLSSFALLPLTSAAQVQTFKKGVANFEKGFYQQAINELKKVNFADSSQQAAVNQYIAEAYRLTNRWLEAIPFYEKAFAYGFTSADALFHYAYALKANGEYERAAKAFEAFVAAKSSNKTLNERAFRELNTLQLISDLVKDTTHIVLQNPRNLNSESTEFSPVRYQNNLVFTASRKAKIYSNGLPYLGIYKMNLNEEGLPSGEAVPFSNNILDPDRNEGSPTFSPDGKFMIFARGNAGKRSDRSPDVDLYSSRLQPDGTWSEAQWVSASDSASWDGSPAFSRNGNVLYFASNRVGGLGGMDLYSVNLDASGRFGEPKNMGRPINTPGDEMFPFVSADGKLYFSSDGHAGLGKLDLFVAIRSGGRTEIKNMGVPFNTSMDDFGLTMDEAGNQYFSSNRAGGRGDDDIYVALAPATTEETPVVTTITPPVDSSAIKIVNYYLAGNIFTQEANRTTPLDSVKVKLFTSEGGLEVLSAERLTTPTGSYSAFKLAEDTDYVVVAERSGYLSKRTAFSMYGRSIPQRLLKKPVTDTTFVVDLFLDKLYIGRTFRLDNIYYDLDKADIRPDAALELDKLVQLLTDNPSIKIELGSHTDTRGSDMYNLRLSQRRAESAIAYIASKGISSERLTAKGYGETQLVVEDARTEEQHQLNRRTEFKVVEITAPDANNE